MYFIELFAKTISDFKNKKGAFSFLEKKEEKEPEICEHIFVPVDSTKEILACSKCGLMVKKSDLEKNKNGGNFFVK